MGYALFTARKMSLQAQVNNYNLKLMQINNEQTKLTEQTTRLQKKNNAIDSAQNTGSAIAGMGGMAAGAAIGTAICPGLGTVIGGAIGKLVGDGGSDLVNSGIDMGQNQQKEVQEAAIAAKQQQLDTEKQRFETLLKSASAELESVEKAEDSAIKSSTPSYVG